MTDRRRMLTGISLGASVAMFSLAVTLNTAAAMPTTANTVQAAQAGLLGKPRAAAMSPDLVRPGLRPGLHHRPGLHPASHRRRVCFWRLGRRVCVWR
jgi:hypothetical protein